MADPIAVPDLLVNVSVAFGGMTGSRVSRFG